MPSKFAVFAIIDNIPGREGMVLMVKDKGKSEPYLWKLPGGKDNGSEYPELALLRELIEEVGVIADKILDTNIIFRKKLPDHEFLVYKANYFNGEVIAGDEIKEVAFFSKEMIEKMLVANEIVPKHAIALSQYIINY